MLKGDPTTLFGILEPEHFDLNAKNIRKDYEAYLLGIGEYDERVFLGDDANEEIGTPSKHNSSGSGNTDDFGEKLAARRGSSMQYDAASLMPTTPLSGKNYLKAKEQMQVTPVSTAKYLVSRLHAMLAKHEAEPSQKLLEILHKCDKDPTEDIKERVKKMGDIFCSHYTSPSDRHPGN